MTEIRFDGRVAVITGAGGGLGRDYARALARRGASVVVNDLGGSGAGHGHSNSLADGVVDEIRAGGGMAVANYDSVATRAGGAAIVQTALDHFGRVDILIHNAGFLRNNRFEDMTDEELDPIIDTHLKAGFYVGQPAYRAMQKQGYGRILLTSSASGVFGSPHQSNYGAAKAGLMGLANCLALEGEPYGIQVNALLPTASTRLAAEMSEEWATLAKLSPDMGLIASTGDPGFVTPLVLYLVSERCRETGQMWSSIGARYARAFVGVADGWYGPRDVPASPEEIAADMGEVTSDKSYYVPLSVTDEFTPVLDRVKQETP